ncbi:hypothetical protein Emag_004141 [Eimeria magna]
MGDAVLDSPLVECPDTQRHSLSAPTAGIDAESCYCKVLVLSPHGMYFPGTTERIAAIEGPEQAVFQVLDWILDKMVDQRQLLDLPLDQHHQLQQQLQQQQQQEEEEQQHGSSSSTGGLISPAGSFPPRATCFRICVPRAVVGCLIGKNGGYIQSLRVATGAAINVSPLFVTAEEACAERVVSVESRRRQSLKTAAFTLVRKINSHPERASCRHVCYFRKHSFESGLPSLNASMQQPAAADFRLIRQQQQQQQQEIDALRRRTVSLVMGASSSTSLPPTLVEVRREASDQQQRQQQQQQQQQRLSSISARHSTGSSAGDNQFAAFKRFCESRGVDKCSRSSSSSAGGPPSQSLSFAASPAPSASKLEPLAALSPADQPDTVAAAAAAAVAATMVKGSSSNSSSKLGLNNTLWDCPSTVCSTAVGSTDRLPLLSDENLRLSQRNTAQQRQQQLQQQMQQQQQQQQQMQQQTQYPSIILLAIIAFLLAALLRLLMQSN